MHVYDWSFAHIEADQLTDVGAAGWVRYIASDAHKSLSRAELARLHDAGLPGALVHEETASWRSWNSTRANQLADGLGWPDDRPIYYAADTDLAPGDYDAVCDVLAHMAGRPRGIYGESGLVQHALEVGAAQFGWIASASSWSRTPAPSAHLLQLIGSPIPGTDANLVLRDDWGQWHPAASHPAPRPVEEEEMPAKTITFPDDPALGPNRGLVAAYPSGGARPWHVPSTDALAILRVLRVVEPQHAATITDRNQQSAVLASLDRNP